MGIKTYIHFCDILFSDIPNLKNRYQNRILILQNHDEYWISIIRVLILKKRIMDIHKSNYGYLKILLILDSPKLIYEIDIH